MNKKIKVVKEVPKEAKPILTDGKRIFYELNETTGFVESTKEKGKWLQVQPLSFLKFGVWRPIEKMDITKIKSIKIGD